MGKKVASQDATSCDLTFIVGHYGNECVTPIVKKKRLDGCLRLKDSFSGAARVLADFFKKRPGIGKVSGIEIHTADAVYSAPEISVATLKRLTNGAIADRFVLSRKKAA